MTTAICPFCGQTIPTYASGSLNKRSTKMRFISHTIHANPECREHCRGSYAAVTTKCGDMQEATR